MTLRLTPFYISVYNIHIVFRKLFGKFICHCYEESDLDNKILLREALLESDDSVVLVGPEGDFSIDEVKLAIENGFRSVSLGNSRLRTETAALVAVHLMRLK
jgi:16S rRNA (uracil1498-N3)-methyltransferase